MIADRSRDGAMVRRGPFHACAVLLCPPIMARRYLAGHSALRALPFYIFIFSAKMFRKTNKRYLLLPPGNSLPKPRSTLTTAYPHHAAYGRIRFGESCLARNAHHPTHSTPCHTPYYISPLYYSCQHPPAATKPRTSTRPPHRARHCGRAAAYPRARTAPVPTSVPRGGAGGASRPGRECCASCPAAPGGLGSSRGGDGRLKRGRPGGGVAGCRRLPRHSRWRRSLACRGVARERRPERESDEMYG